jgi:simple sugar transport system permease protein
MPFPTLLGCLLFGGVAALEVRVQGWHLPLSSYVIQMTPYLAALAVLAGIGRGARLPAAIGTAFTRN